MYKQSKWKGKHFSRWLVNSFGAVYKGLLFEALSSIRVYFLTIIIGIECSFQPPKILRLHYNTVNPKQKTSIFIFKAQNFFNQYHLHSAKGLFCLTKERTFLLSSQ